MMSSDFLIDTGDLPRRPGSMRELERTITLTEPMGTTVIAVPSGQELHLEGAMESAHDGVLITLHVNGQAHGECVRCLDDVSLPLAVRVQELYAYPGSQADLGEDDERLPELVADQADIAEAITDAVVLELPFQPLCSPDCPGLCPDCGIRLADAPEDHGHENLDPRWAALAALVDDEE